MHDFDTHTVTFNPLVDSSHDLKTLANGVLCMSALLEKTPLSIEQSELVDLLKKSASELSALTHQILNQQKNPATGIFPHNAVFGLKEKITAVFDTFSLTFSQKNIDKQLVIEGNLPARVRGDHNALQRILSNLLHNAGKFTFSGSIKLRVTTAQNRGQQSIIRFEVQDTGVGICPENLPHIFDRYAKFDSDGYGLGLSNVKNLVEMQGGSIEVASRQGEGTLFTVVLPFQSLTAPAMLQTHFSNTALESKKILIADDDVVYLKYLTTILAEKRVNISTATSAYEALQLVENQSFDAIMIDLNLPDATGFELAAMIQESFSPNRHTPLVGMTAGKVEFAENMSCGLLDILEKPLNTEGVVLRLLNAMEKNKKSAFSANTSASAFESQLDVAHLTALYGNDTEHAALMFETFLEESVKDFYDVFNYLKVNDLVGVKRLVHRFKSAFSMVGLTEIEAQLFDLEQNLQNYSTLHVLHFLKNIEQKIQDCTPILKKQLKKLKNLKSLKTLNHDNALCAA